MMMIWYVIIASLKSKQMGKPGLPLGGRTPYISTAKNGYWDVLSAEKPRPHLPDYVIYVTPSYWKLISFVYWPRKDVPLDWFREFY